MKTTMEQRLRLVELVKSQSLSLDEEWEMKCLLQAVNRDIADFQCSKQGQEFIADQLTKKAVSELVSSTKKKNAN